MRPSLPTATQVGNPGVNIAIFAVVRRRSRWASSSGPSRSNTHGRGLLRRRARRSPAAQNGIAISGDYLSAASLPRHRRRHRDQRLRRVPLLDRLPRRLARGPAARRRAAAQHRPVHDGRRAVVPAAPAPGPHGRGDLHARRSASSTCWPRWPARAAWSRCCSASTATSGRASSSPSSASIMIIYVLVGGMKGTTWVQIVKAVLLIVGAGGHDGAGCWASTASTCPTLLGEAVDEQRPPGEELLEPGPAVRQDRRTTKIDFISLVARARARHRRPAARADALLHRALAPRRPGAVGGVGDLADRHLLPVHAGPRLRRRARWSARTTIKAAPGKANSAAPLLAFELGGDAPARDHLGGRLRDDPRGRGRADDHGERVASPTTSTRSVIKRGEVGADDEVKVARITAVVIGCVAIIGGIFANGQNIAFLVALAFAVAASANLPTILYSLFWKRFNTRGALWSIYGGLISCVTLIIFSPGRLGQAGRPGHRQEPVDDHRRRGRLPLVPAGQPGHRLDPAGASSSAGSAPSRARSAPARPSTPRWRSARSPAPAPRRPSRTEHHHRETPAGSLRGGSRPVRRTAVLVCGAVQARCCRPRHVLRPGRGGPCRRRSR